MLTTNILDIDIGNSYTKWRCGEIRGREKGQIVPQIKSPIKRVRISNVGGEEQQIFETVSQLYRVQPEFARSVSNVAGVKNGYAVPSQLGVDRWLALLAAYNTCRQACIVIDAGTALTIDVVDNEGQHLGGYIVPGFQTCLKSLETGTQELITDLDTGGQPYTLGDNTQLAISNGTVGMLCAFIQDTITQTRSRLNDLEIWLTGGETPLIEQCIQHPVRKEPDLVLNGLALSLP